MPLLREVFALVKRYHAEGVMLNVETKVEAGAPSETAPREAEPRLPLVALTNRDFLQTGRPGASPWLGGIDIDDFGGDPLKAIKLTPGREVAYGGSRTVRAVCAA